MRRIYLRVRKSGWRQTLQLNGGRRRDVRVDRLLLKPLPQIYIITQSQHIFQRNYVTCIWIKWINEDQVYTKCERSSISIQTWVLAISI